jgi:hypothetical protein
MYSILYNYILSKLLITFNWANNNELNKLFAISQIFQFIIICKEILKWFKFLNTVALN